MYRPPSQYCSSDESSKSESPEYIDIKEFSNTCAILKNEIKQNKNARSAFDSNLEEVVDEVGPSVPLVNPSLIAKWQSIFENFSNNFESEELKNMIESEDASLNTEASRKEATLARRIARCRLLSAQALKTDTKCNKTLNSPSPTIQSNLPISAFPGNVTGSNLNSTSVTASDVILSVSVFLGGKPSQFNPAHRQDIEIRASDSLATLPEAVYCLSRRASNDIITDPCQCAVLDSSSFLFIEGTFYDEELDDLGTGSRPSDIYYESLKAVGDNSPTAHLLCNNPSSVQQASLKATKWLDLKVRLNTPYLFVHLGGCEHVFIITQIRSASLSDEKHLLLPHVTQSLKVRRRKCRICEVYAGTKLLVDDKLLPENPCVVCDKCYVGFHGADKDWYKDFEVVPYYHEV